MTVYLPRSAWTSTPTPTDLAAMPRSPKGVAVHWPGSKYKIGAASQKAIGNRLEAYRRFHVSSRGWTDIAYQAAGDQAGRVWELRGIEHESAANGDQTVNRTWGAFLFVIGQGEAPSSALLGAFNDWRENRWLKRFPRAGQVVGHRDIRPHGGTDCPGPATEALIKSGAILEDDMTPAEVKQAVTDALADFNIHDEEAEAATGKETFISIPKFLAKKVARRADVGWARNQLLAAVKAGMQAGPSADADAIVDEIATRLGGQS